MFTTPPSPSIGQLLRRHQVPAMVLCSTLATGMLATRVLYTGSFSYRFLVWNLFLAWIPYLCALAFDSLSRSTPAARGAKMILAAMWLAFLPNAPYIMTDFVHLSRSPTSAPWFDALMLMTFAWSGLCLGIVSLMAMHDQVRQRFGAAPGWLFAGTVIGLCGIGVYMGRVLRWNTWDLLRRPGHVGSVLLDVLANPQHHTYALAVSGVFASVLMVAYFSFATRRTRSLTVNA